MVGTTSLNASTAASVPPASRLYSTGWFRNLFQSELWERFAFFGVQAILVLYAVAPSAEGGLGLSAGSGAALFGAYIGVTFMLALPGGWFADRVIGQQRAIVIGPGAIALGCFTLALPPDGLTPLGLLLIACGFGLFKPNHQAMINILAGNRGRREAAIAALFVGTQVIGLAAPLIVGSIGERVSWSLAFATIGGVLTVGVVAVRAGLRSYGPVGAGPSRPLSPEEKARLNRRVLPIAVAVAVLLIGALGTGLVPPMAALMVIGLGLIAAPWGAYAKLRRHPGLGADDRWRLSVMLRLLLAATLFWLLAGQDGSVLTLFAKDSTDREVFGFTLPASWLQGATPLFMLLIAPIFAWQLPRLGARFGVPAKFAFGLAVAAVSFLVMAMAAVLAADGQRVSPLWLLTVYLMHACGEIVVAAVSISAISDLVPRPFLGQGIGVYWLFAAMGGGLSSQVAALIDVLSAPVYYLSLGLLAGAVAVVFVVNRRRLGAPFAAVPDRTGAPDPAVLQ